MIKRAISRIDNKYFNKFLYRRFRPRRARIYCTGTPKSGTHSIANIFKGSLRSVHEPNREELRILFFKIKNDEISDQELRKIVEKRENALYLEVNSSCFNYIIVEQLVAEYPDAKFIHPIREPRGWLNSWINHDINHRSEKIHQGFKSYFNEIFKQDEFYYAPEEKVLMEMKLPTIEGMLCYWHSHNKKILESVPDDRLLVLSTKSITDNIDKIVRFSGLNDMPDKANSHAYKTSEKHNILDSINNDFLEQKLKKYTAEFNNWTAV